LSRAGTDKEQHAMTGGYRISLRLAALVAMSSVALAQPAPTNPDAQQNVRASQQYEQALCGNKAFRDKRIAQECGPITDPQLHQSCLASFECGRSPPRTSRKAPPSETIR
jgi:hypothetical protein